MFAELVVLMVVEGDRDRVDIAVDGDCGGSPWTSRVLKEG